MSLGDVLATRPLRTERGIPVFSETSDYIASYERTAADHLAETAKSGHNPFIREELWQASERATVDLVRRYTLEGGRTLDVGVGLGRILEQLPGLERYGMDISLDYLEVARDKGIAVVFSLIEDMPFRADTFDVVLATDVLEHVLDLNDALRRILRVLRPGGLLFIRSPDREDLTQYYDPSFPYRFAHLRTFDAVSLQLLLTRAFGLEIVEIAWPEPTPEWNYMRLRPAVPNLVARAFTKLIGRPLSRLRSPIARRLIKALYRPVELNVVARKATSPEVVG